MKKTLFVCGLVIAAMSALAFAPRSGASTPSNSVTFTRDVAPILYKNCAVCHRPGEIAPMSLMTYKDARPWARSIKEKVLDRTMPPWHADAPHGTFKNDRSLSKQDIDTLVAWVDNGAPEGDPRLLPATPTFSEGWHIGTPDVVLSMPVDFKVPADGVVDYTYFVVPTNFTEDRWIQAAEVKMGNSSVVHHVIVFLAGPDADLRTMARGEGGLEALTGIAPGEAPMQLPDGVGKYVKAGSKLIFQMHYTPNGVATTDKTSVGIIFSKKPVLKAMVGGAAMNRRFAIPAGDGDYKVVSSFTVQQDSHIIDMMPHMHLRGKDFEVRLTLPDGTAKTILSVPHYDFNWQTRYELATPIAAPKGSRVDCIAHFDNSTNNKFNPDPSREVRWGPQTWEEMMIGFVGMTLDHQNLLETAAAQRK